MLSISRRRVLLSALAASLSGHALAQQVSGASYQIDEQTLSAYLDVLLPADDLTPAASALNVAGDLIDFASESPQFGQFLAVGTQWLNKTGRGPFHTLSLSDQERVVKWMSKADRDTLPGRFFLLVRLTGVEFYYSKPEVARAFGLNTAPQPAGYPPPWQ
ncbi:MAG: gluconate 2-dehydrogenase subunit 3 family protein [Tateyamaria sp.]|uniref:gluconate 2-dehydrogenase subunit 3 family protein n=1 Tax=Tateyamaria sp. TaxID=1929288 RepID=UPI0032788319